MILSRISATAHDTAAAATACGAGAVARTAAAEAATGQYCHSKSRNCNLHYLKWPVATTAASRRTNM